MTLENILKVFLFNNFHEFILDNTELFLNHMSPAILAFFAIVILHLYCADFIVEDKRGAAYLGHVAHIPHHSGRRLGGGGQRGII